MKITYFVDNVEAFSLQKGDLVLGDVNITFEENKDGFFVYNAYLWSATVISHLDQTQFAKASIAYKYMGKEAAEQHKRDRQQKRLKELEEYENKILQANQDNEGS